MTTNIVFGGAALIVPSYRFKGQICLFNRRLNFLEEFSEIWGDGLKWSCDQQFSFGGAALIVPTFIGSKVKLLILLYSINFLAGFSEI